MSFLKVGTILIQGIFNQKETTPKKKIWILTLAFKDLFQTQSFYTIFLRDFFSVVVAVRQRML